MDRQFKIILIFLIGLSTACFAEPQGGVEETRTPRDEHKGAFEAVTQILKDVGIKPHVNLYAVYGTDASINARIGWPSKSKAPLGWANGRNNIYLTSRVLDYFISNNPLLQAVAKFTLLHEYGHLENRHTEKKQDRAAKKCSVGDFFNVQRQHEYEADQAAYSRMTDNELLACRAWIESGDTAVLAAISRPADLYPTLDESVMMISEE